MGKYRRIIAVEGDWGCIECVRRETGEAPARDFLNSLGEDAALFFALFEEMAANGRTNNPERFSHECRKIYGFKHKIGNKQARFACFQDGNKWVLTHGFWKPGAQQGKGKWPAREIDRAETIMKEYWDQLN